LNFFFDENVLDFEIYVYPLLFYWFLKSGAFLCFGSRWNVQDEEKRIFWEIIGLGFSLG
jgi:hypothetical protein